MKIGLEIHFQLRGNKLFCSCSTEGNDFGVTFERKLTPVMGEMGRLDNAVEYENIRNRDFLYRVSDNSCLVETDEEPPHSVNPEALKTSIAISEALNCKIIDYASFMRKIVIDGSNTSGFQRTGIIGMDGFVKTSRGNVRISTITLEEDACRKISEKHGIAEYSLGRLGTPLIEIATEPDIIDPEHALDTAKTIGHYVMSMNNFRGEVDSIRQDVNFSMGFGRVEIKGVSKLSFIKDTIKYEIRRQNSLKEISDKLSGKSPEIGDFMDITYMFEKTGSSMIKKAVASGKSVMCAKVSRCNHLMKFGNYKLGREFADVAKNMGIGGLMHSDEFPAYGLTDEELGKIYSSVGKQDEDAVIVVLADKPVISALRALLEERLKKIIKLELEETRAATPSGETRYLRPLAGKERMYPETDIPLVEITEELKDGIKDMVPKSLDDVMKELTAKYGLSSVESESMINNNIVSLFKSLTGIFNNSRIIARLLLQTMPELERKTGRAVTREELNDLKFNVFVGKYKSRAVTREELNEILKIASVKEWDRNTIEHALSIYMTDKTPIKDLEDRDELNVLTNDQIRKLIGKISFEENITEKNLIFLFKKKTKYSFNPAKVIKIFHEMKKHE
jgi:glutamyl-tRNA(Gln) amidotransferase subunit E